MMSRLNQSNTRFALFSQRWGIPEIVGGPCALTVVRVRGAAALRYRVPSSPVPWPTLQQPHHREQAAPDQAVLAQRLDRVLATGRREPARGQPHRRHGMAVQLDEEDRAADNGRAVASPLGCRTD